MKAKLVPSPSPEKTEQEKVKTRARTPYFGVNRVLRQRL